HHSGEIRLVYHLWQPSHHGSVTGLGPPGLAGTVRRSSFASRPRRSRTCRSLSAAAPAGLELAQAELESVSWPKVTDPSGRTCASHCSILPSLLARCAASPSRSLSSRRLANTVAGTSTCTTSQRAPFLA